MSIRAVYDTMLFFQAASQPQRIRATMQAVRDGRVTLCISAELLAEIQDVLTRPEYQSRFPTLNPEAVRLFLADITSMASVFDPIPMRFTWPQHPDDDHLFNLAIAANANYLVTWETRLLRLFDSKTPAAKLLRELAPNLAIRTPKQLADSLRSGFSQP